MTQLLLWLGGVGPLLFMAIFLADGATRPGYSARRHFVSELALGERGWLQVANFAMVGSAELAAALGASRVLRAAPGCRLIPVLLAIIGLALVASGVFRTDPALGYPPGSGSSWPPGPATSAGTVHGVAGAVVFFTLTIACLVGARRFQFLGNAGGSILSGAAGVVALGGFIGAGILADRDRGRDPRGSAGLAQRAAIIASFTWLAAFAFSLLWN